MIHLRAPRGFGDALYLRAVALHLIERGEALTVYTLWPDAFLGLPVATLHDDARSACNGAMRHVAYGMPRANPQRISNFSAACRCAGIDESVALRLDWLPRDAALIERVRCAAAGRPVLIYQPPKRPGNAEQALVRPSREAFAGYLESRADHFRVRVGRTPYVDAGEGLPCDLDLVDRTSVAGALDVGLVGDLFFGEPCFVPFLGEALGRRYAVMFTRRALNCPDAIGGGRVRNITPERLFHKPELASAVYDES